MYDFNRAKSWLFGGSMRRSKGFTLIELMVTIGVLAIIATIAAPSFNHQIQKMQLRDDMQKIMDLARETRSEAIFKKDERTFTLATTLGAGFKNWQPSSNIQASPLPSTLTYNLFGYLKGDPVCLIVTHQKNSQLKYVIYFNKNGSLVYKQDQSTCTS